MIVVSAFTPAGLINNSGHDFGSIIRFIEHNFGITESALTFADSRATTDLTGFFALTTAGEFVTIPGGQSAGTFLAQPIVDPDDD